MPGSSQIRLTVRCGQCAIPVRVAGSRGTPFCSHRSVVPATVGQTVLLLGRIETPEHVRSDPLERGAVHSDDLHHSDHVRLVSVPPNRPRVRLDLSVLVFARRNDKERAAVEEIRRLHASGRPVLVGTASVEESERLAALVRGAGAPCRVLNARNDEEEAAVIAQAGDVGAVTISTNMAGRGVDIRLGGAREERADAVRALGGLFVLGTNRHEARRIDDQLRGRAGRQGDPGESRGRRCFATTGSWRASGRSSRRGGTRRPPASSSLPPPTAGPPSGTPSAKSSRAASSAT